MAAIYVFFAALAIVHCATDVQCSSDIRSVGMSISSTKNDSGQGKLENGSGGNCMEGCGGRDKIKAEEEINGTGNGRKLQREANSTDEVPPKLEASYPEDIHFIGGETIVLWSNATGTPPPRIIWSYQADENSDPEIIEDGLDEKDIILVKGGKLILYDVVENYEGIYSCVAENEFGQSSSSKTYNLQIKERVPVLIDDGKPAEVILHKGDSYTLSCSSSSPENLSYRWFKDEKYLIKSHKYFTFNEDKSKLTLRRVKPHLHNGTYRCTVSNGVGYASKLFTISVGNRRARNFF